MKQIFILFCLIFGSSAAFAQAPATGTTTTTVQTAPVAQAPIVAPKVPVAPQATVTAPAAPKIIAPAAPVTASDSEVQAQLKTSVTNEFRDQLPFTLDEPKMIAFTEATRRVKKINDKWDVQIASAESDKMAIEYNNMAVEEITQSLQNIPGLTLDQYNAMTKLTATNPSFNRVYLAYRELIEQGKIKPPTIAKPAIPAPAKPTVQAPKTAVPLGPGTVPAPQGSPKPQYSPPVSPQ